MYNKFKIDIPQPCHENWYEMTIADKEKFCTSCKKVVHDFTTSTDRQIIDALYNNDKLCGRFNSTQLNRNLNISVPRKSIWITSTSILLSLLQLGNHETKAQEKNPIEIANKAESNISKKNKTKFVITGTVSDSYGPISNVLIKINRSKKTYSTDSLGMFSIEVKKGNTLRFIFLGLNDVEIAIKNNQPLNIIMEEQQGNQREIILGAIGYKRKTYIGRILTKICHVIK